MRILLTNDDGCDAAGLLALYQAVRQLGFTDIRVIAPATAQSGCGHQLSPSLVCRRRVIDGIGEVLAVEGTSADCVRVMLALDDGPRPDWVLSGINHGGNLGVDVYRSGTVAAAREATICGMNAIAISQLIRSPMPTDWNRTAREAAAVLGAIMLGDRAVVPEASLPLHAGTLAALREAGDGNSLPSFWNVNLPKTPEAPAPLGVRLTEVSPDPTHIAYDLRREDDGTIHLKDVGVYLRRPARAGSDVETAFSGYVAISRVAL